MAELLTVDALLANQAEPKRAFRWILSLNGIDAFTALSATRPGGGAFAEHMIPFINSKRFLAGTFTPDTFALTLWDPIAPSAAQKVNQWVKLNFENTSGRSGYADLYKKDFELRLLDPPGGVAEKWSIHGAWPQTIRYGDLSYAADGNVEINLTIRYDRAFLIF